jgi:choline-sulfatase
MGRLRNPSRREFLQATGALAVGGALGLNALAENTPPAKAAQRTGSRGRPGRRERPPNILLLLVDEMRYPPIYEAAGAKRFRQQYLLTQNALRAHGVEFHRHYVASTACAPSRASLFTGHYPSLHGVTNTDGAAKKANDPDVFWLDPAGVPTLGDYFRAGGYRTFYKGKWHVSDADLQIPGTHEQIVSYDAQGNRDSEKEQLYLDADRLDGYGFSDWIGPEPHGSAPLNTGGSAANAQGRDVGFANQTVELIEQLDADRQNDPWLMVASFVNPHDIALWGFFARATGLFDFTVEEVVPGFGELFDPVLFAQTLADDLDTKPSCQKSYQSSYHEWMQGVPPRDYFRFYYQLHKEVDAELMAVYNALQQSRFFDNTLVVFTSDHGDLLGAHRYMHQKWYQAYDEALRVPLIISNERLFLEPDSVHSLTSHIDLLPTLLGLAGLDPSRLQKEVAKGHSDPRDLVGRNLAPLVLGQAATVADPIYFMSDDDPSRGPNQENVFGVAYDSVIQPNHIETVIVEIDGEVWKYSRYFDNPQFWSDPDPRVGPPKDVVLTVDDKPIDIPGEHPVEATKRVKFTPEDEEFEMYNVTQDPMELHNLSGKSTYADKEAYLAGLLAEQRTRKRLYPISGAVPGQPF